MRRKLLGFTMIELLIVIAVLGVLAVAVLSAINPIEQINRAKDTGNRSDAEQFLSAVDRFYTSLGYYPWFQNMTDSSNAEGQCALGDSSGVLSRTVDGTWYVFSVSGAGGTVTCAENTGGDAVLDRLSTGATAELKKSFVDRISSSNYNQLYVYHRGGSNDSVYVCFRPKSGAFKQEAYDRCASGLPSDIDGVNVTGGTTSYAANSVASTICGGSTDPANLNPISGNDYYVCLP